MKSYKMLGLCIFSLVLFTSYSYSQTSLILSPSTRSYGIGQTGVADNLDPANSYFNPAILFSFNGVYLSYGWASLNPEHFDNASIFNVGITGGTQYSINKTYALGIGAELRLNRVSYGKYNLVIGNWPRRGVSISEHYYNMTFSTGLKINDKYYMGLGYTAQPIHVKDVSPNLNEWIEDNKLVHDIGIYFKDENLISTSEYSLSPSFGISYQNIGIDSLDIGGLNWIVPGCIPKALQYGIGVHIDIKNHTITNSFNINIDVLKDMRENVNNYSDIYASGIEMLMFSEELLLPKLSDFRA